MKDVKNFQERYNRWKNGERYWDIRDVELPKYDTGKTSTEKKDDFYSWMDKLADKKAQDWTKVPMKPLDPALVEMQMLNDPQYNYETFYNLEPFMAERMLQADPDAHFTDIGKTMYHPTFSDESAFSGYVNDFNPLGIIGGSWNEAGDVYTPSRDQLEKYFNYETTRRYLDRAEKKPVRINIPEFHKGKGDNRSKYYDFVATLGPSLYKTIRRKGIENAENFYDYGMKQMGSESKFGTSEAATEGFNFGGVKPGTSYTKYKSVDDFTEKWVDMMTRMYPNAIIATTPEAYVKALRKNIEGKSYFKDSPQIYLDNIKYAKTLGKYMKMFRDQNGKLFEILPEVVDEKLTMPIYEPNNKILNTVEIPIQQYYLNNPVSPKIKIPFEPQPFLDSDGNPIVFNRGKSGIHINPANRGKFNATKKRTGKTTEELTHSKNPLTRKRAIFALNASKWNH